MTTTINADQIDDAIDQIEFNPDINMDIVVKYMDDDIRKAIHDEMHEVQQFISEISFLRVYIERHFDKFGEIFQVN